MPKYYKWEGGAVHRLSFATWSNTIHMEKGPMLKKPETHSMKCLNFQHVNQEMGKLNKIARKKGYQTFAQICPNRGISEEYYLPEEELHKIIFNKLMPPDYDNETLRESEQRKDQDS